MGSPNDDPQALMEEKPSRLIKITCPFELGQFEVTQEEFEVVMGTNPSHFSGRDNRDLKDQDTRKHPVDSVSWFDAIRFCNRLSIRHGLPPYYEIKGDTVIRRGGLGYRLPTEVEWEYACRAGTTTRWSFGDDPKQLDHYAWHDGNSSNRTHPVGTKKPNPWGLYDMHGNVAEWCWDRYDAKGAGAHRGQRPSGAGGGADRAYTAADSGTRGRNERAPPVATRSAPSTAPKARRTTSASASRATWGRDPLECRSCSVENLGEAGEFVAAFVRRRLSADRRLLTKAATRTRVSTEHAEGRMILPSAFKRDAPPFKDSDGSDNHFPSRSGERIMRVFATNLLLAVALVGHASPLDAYCGPDWVPFPGVVQSSVPCNNYLLCVNDNNHILAVDLLAGRTFDLGSADGRRRTGDVADGRALLLSGDRLQVVELASDKTVGKTVHEIAVGNAVRAFGFAGKGQAFLHLGRTVNLVELATGKTLHTIELAKEEGFRPRPSSAWQKVGDRLFVVGSDGSLCDIDLAAGTLRERFWVESRAGIADLRVEGEVVYCLGSHSTWATRLDHLTCFNLKTKKSAECELSRVAGRTSRLAAGPKGTAYLIDRNQIDRFDRSGPRVGACTPALGEGVQLLNRLEQPGRRRHEGHDPHAGHQRKAGGGSGKRSSLLSRPSRTGGYSAGRSRVAGGRGSGRARRLRLGRSLALPLPAATVVRPAL